MEHFVTFPKLGIELTVKETAFKVGSFSIQWYGVLIGIGFILALLYAFKSVDKMNVDEDKLIDVVIWGIIGGVIGARVYYIIFYPGGNYLTGDTLMDNIYLALNIHSGGMGFFGGLMGGLLFAGITARIKKMNIASFFDLAALGFLIGQAIGRWGNFTNQEAFGEPTDLPWGMASDLTGGVPVHPCFLYESILCLIGFVFLHFFTRKLRRYDGQTFLLYIVWYGFIRFFIELLRTDSLMIGSLRVSVVVSALSVVAGIVMLIVFRSRTRLSGCGAKEIVEINNVIFGSLRREKEKMRKQEKSVESQTIINKLDDEKEQNEKAESSDVIEENEDVKP